MKRKIKWKNVLLLLFIIICLIELSVSIFNIIKWKLDSKNTNNQITDIQDKVDIKKTVDSDNTEIIEQEEIDESNPYWDYIKMSLIDVDFSKLKNINNQTKGWLQVNGTNINYPFVQSSDNKYYLKHSFDKSYNSAGWVFLDYRNNLSNNDKNTIIYAHGRSDKTMFGTLKNILTNGWVNNTDNYVVKLSTEYENTLWQVFSVYRIKTTSDYLQVNFNNDSEFLEFSNMLIDRSQHNFDTNVGKNDKILTLSTCYNNSEKVVLHAKLIKREVK